MKAGKSRRMQIATSWERVRPPEAYFSHFADTDRFSQYEFALYTTL